jgi:hypothetical protein
MSRRSLWALSALLVVAAVSGATLARGGAAGPSALSRGAEGLSGTRSYLEAAGTTTELLAVPWEHQPGPGVLVLAFPRLWGGGVEGLEGLSRHLAAGGDVLVAYSGGAGPGPFESILLRSLGASGGSWRLAPPLAPWSWRREIRSTWMLSPEAGEPRLELRRPRWLPDVPANAGRLLEGPGQEVVAAWWRWESGRVVVLPAELLANARLASPGHADLLETLRELLAEPWRFDEYHHGLVTPGTGPARTSRRGLDGFLAQLLLVYLAAVAALARRLGDPWRTPSYPSTTGASLLLRLGRWHHRLGHEEEAMDRLVQRARELYPRWRSETVASRQPGEGLLALARRLST